MANTMQNAISLVYWTNCDRFAFQVVDGWFRLYGDGGRFLREFDSFDEMDEYIRKHAR